MPDHKPGPGQVYQRDHQSGDVWRWASGHGPGRWRLAVLWAEKRVKGASDDLSRRHWAAVEKAFAAKLAKLRAHNRQNLHDPQFDPVMLNGHPGNVVAAVKQSIARMVTLTAGYVTATTDGSHATGSYHYPANNPDARTRAQNLGRAFDTGGPADTGYLKHFHNELARGASHYLELFGPPSPYVKNGQLINSTSPDVPNHCHCAPELNA